MCHFHKHSELEITSLIDKSTISMCHFLCCYVTNYQRVISFRSPSDFHPPVDWGFVVWPWWTRSNLRPRRFQTLAAKTKRPQKQKGETTTSVLRFSTKHIHIIIMHYIHLVGGLNHLEKYESQWEGWHPIYYGKQNVPNHQPNTVAIAIYIYITLSTRTWNIELKKNIGFGPSSRNEKKGVRRISQMYT